MTKKCCGKLAEKKANKITWEQPARIGAFVLVLVLILVGAMHIAEGADLPVSVYRGADRTFEGFNTSGDVEVVRGMSDYKSAPIMEPVEPEVNSARQFWDEYDQWRAREIRRKLYPRP